jgi:hypothetical protein
MPSSETAEKAKIAADQAGAPITKWEALKARGWVQPYDYWMITIILGTIVTMFFWAIFGQPTAINLIAVVLVDIFISQLWLISLVYRCSCFVLETQADINLMPESAARIVAGYFSMNGNAATNRTRR